MSKHIENQYHPDVVSPPGDTLAETLEAIEMSQAELARRTGRPPKTINEIIQGKATITAETAIQLEHVLGIPASFWNERERRYRESLAEQEKVRQLRGQVDWLKQFPIKKMIDLGWLKKYDDKAWQLRELLRYFGIASPQQWETMTADFRQSPAFQADPMAVSAWLRQGEQEARRITCKPYDAQCFKAVLSQVRTLTIEKPEVFVPQLIGLCASCGVAVVVIPELPKTRLSGAARWLTSEKALIQITMRYKSDDQFWFTFFHEAGHILKHGKRDVFIDTEDDESDGKEAEADAFAADTLIPPEDWHVFIAARGYKSKAGIEAFATEIDIAPGIVVGRLQHEHHLPFSHCNSLKARLDWKNDQENAT